MKKERINKLIVADTQWAKTIPEWLLNEVKAERMVYGLASIMGKDVPKVGDAEVLLYLCTAALHAPLTSEYARAYQYLLTEIMKKRGQEVPEDIRVETLNSDEKRELEELRSDIASKRGEVTNPLFDVLKELKKEGKRKDNTLKNFI